MPGTDSLVQKEIEKSVAGIHKDMLKPLNEASTSGTPLRNYFSLPVKGLKFNEVLEELDKHAQLGNVDWRNGKVSGAIYHGGKELSRLINEAFSLFTVSNVPFIWRI